MHQDGSTHRKSLRLWPGVIAAALQWIAWLIIPVVVPDWAGAGIIGAVVLGAVIVLWWLFFSRAPWSERLGAIAVMIVAIVATRPLTDISIQNVAEANATDPHSIVQPYTVVYRWKRTA